MSRSGPHGGDGAADGAHGHAVQGGEGAHGGEGAQGAEGVPTREEYLALWARLHRVPAPSGLVRWWLGLVHAVAAPLARAGTSPLAVTAAGLVVSAACVPVALAGGRWALGVPVLVAVSGVLDNLDGAVAVLRARTSAWGALLDAVADRLADTAYLLALWALGAPGPVVAAGAGLALLAEYVRARAASAGAGDVGVITVGERPTRVLLVTMTALGAGLYPASATTWASVGAWASVVTGAVAMVQLLPVVRRQLRGAPPPS